MIKLKLLGLVDNKNIIPAVRDIRSLLGNSLKEAKDIADSLRGGETFIIEIEDSVLAESDVSSLRYVVVTPDVSAIRDSLVNALIDLIETRRFDLVKDLALVLKRL